MIVQLTKFWLTALTDGVSVSGQSADGRPFQSSVRGEVRTYAGGRQRAVGSVGRSATWQIQLEELTLDQVIQLETWMGEGITVFARDHRGQSMYATFFGVDRGERKSQTWQNSRYTATIQLHRVDVVEGV